MSEKNTTKTQTTQSKKAHLKGKEQPFTSSDNSEVSPLSPNQLILTNLSCVVWTSAAQFTSQRHSESAQIFWWAGSTTSSCVNAKCQGAGVRSQRRDYLHRRSHSSHQQRDLEVGFVPPHVPLVILLVANLCLLVRDLAKRLALPTRTVHLSGNPSLCQGSR